MIARSSTVSLGWLAFVGLAVLASTALLRRERPAPAVPVDADDLLVRIYR
ncbi:MAG TPA: hypothetical protein VK002_05020 [Rubricoccaceae bacterium]|nr:hypothetical protein [Rubricoccaceae bacterium]